MGGTYDQMRQTLRLIGKAIRRGSTYLPLRNHAAALATLAPPKNYLAQVSNLYRDMQRRWRYVKDPVSRELLTFGPHALWQLVLAGDGRGVGRGRGAGDCDCAAAAMGAMLEAIGMPVRLAVTAPPGSPPGRLFAHVFVQANIPKMGWVTVDPVVYPQHGLGYTPKHSRIAFFTLEGRKIGARGNVVGLSGAERITDMDPNSQWQDYGLGGADYEGGMPEDWRMYGLPDFGQASEIMGLMEDGGDIPAEVEYAMYGGRPLARSPLMEVHPNDYQYMQAYGMPYDGMGAMGDDGEQYYFDGNLGFFKKLFRRVKKRVRKVARRIRKGIRKVVKKIPGGKYLIKLGRKVWKVAKKFVKPLVKFVGKYAAKLAPIAALIPGWGPAIAAGLYTAGKIANLMQTYGVKIAGVAGKVRKLVFPSGARAKGFQKALRQAANREKLRQQAGGKVKKIGGRPRRRSRGRAIMGRARRLARRRLMRRRAAALARRTPRARRRSWGRRW